MWRVRASSSHRVQPATSARSSSSVAAEDVNSACAFVELKEGAKATEAEIIAYCRSQMSGFKTPKAVVFGPIPKTSTGKIQKFLLRNEVGSAKAISA